MNKTPDDILHRVSNLEIGDSSRAIYDDWSETYDDHLVDEFGYLSPGIAADALAAAVDERGIEVIDYGCGTGLVGEALRRRGFGAVDGIDVSPGMLAQARAKRVYRNLVCGDLTGRIGLADGSYDAATCIGSMGAGHVGADHVPELLRPLKSGAPLVVIMNGAYYESGGFDAAFRQMQDDGLWEIAKLEQFNYMAALERPGWLLLARKAQ